MYSEALAIMDRNTVRYMIEEQKKENERQMQEIEKLRLENEQQRQEKDAEIQRLRQLLSQRE